METLLFDLMSRTIQDCGRDLPHASASHVEIENCRQPAGIRWTRSNSRHQRVERMVVNPALKTLPSSKSRKLTTNWRSGGCESAPSTIVFALPEDHLNYLPNDPIAPRNPKAS